MSSHKAVIPKKPGHRKLDQLFEYMPKNIHNLVEHAKKHDLWDTPDMHDREKENHLPHSELTRTILGCCFEVMKELGPGFQERIYKNALLIVMKQKGLQVEIEKPFKVMFRDKVIGRYILHAGSFLNFESHHGGPSLSHRSSPILRQYGPPRDNSNLNHPEASKIQESTRVQYSADLVVEKMIIVELKCCASLIREHQAQLFNYLKVSELPIGLLINFQQRKLESQRLHRSDVFEKEDAAGEEPIPF